MRMQLGIREFILYSRKGRTDSFSLSLREAGRLDIVHECIQAGLFLSHGIRRNVVFHALLGGPPRPPLCLTIDGSTLRDVRTDQEAWRSILRRVLAGESHSGLSLERRSFESLLKVKADQSSIYVLEEDGEEVDKIQIGKNPVFVLGDHIGLPKKAEAFALRYGVKISLGKQAYLAASCIAILNYLLDRRRGHSVTRQEMK